MLLNTVLNSATARQFRDTIFKILRVLEYCISSILSQLCTISDSWSATFSQITKKLLNICSLTFTMLISTTTRQTSNCMQIITYHFASSRTNHFQNTPCPAVSYFLDFAKIQIEKNRIILCYIPDNCAIVLFCFLSITL